LSGELFGHRYKQRSGPAPYDPSEEPAQRTAERHVLCELGACHVALDQMRTVMRARGTGDSLTQTRGGSTRVIVHVLAGKPLGLLTMVLPTSKSPFRLALSITSPPLHRGTSIQAAQASSGLAYVTAEPPHDSM
jgi:hypothetical protein